MISDEQHYQPGSDEQLSEAALMRIEILPHDLKADHGDGGELTTLAEMTIILVPFPE
jgi:hypothetical protein